MIVDYDVCNNNLLVNLAISLACYLKLFVSQYLVMVMCPYVGYFS